MKPSHLKTSMFVDSGNPEETKEAIQLLGFLDGQTTNPTLISRHPEAKKRLEKGETFTEEEIFGFYREIVQAVSAIIPDGSVSVEVYADASTKAEEMLAQGRDMFSWLPNAHIKFPTTAEGLKAAHQAVQEGMRINMTLCFSQEQAAAVYAATMGAKAGDVYVSPFVGRLDDRGENGMDLIENIIQMYEEGDGHVQVLTASVRNLNHFIRAIQLGSDIVTAPLSILREWGEQGMKVPGPEFQYRPSDLQSLLYKDLRLEQSWQSFDISHDLTDQGLERFAADWNALIRKK